MNSYFSPGFCKIATLIFINQKSFFQSSTSDGCFFTKWDTFAPWFSGFILTEKCICFFLLFRGVNTSSTNLCFWAHSIMFGLIHHFNLLPWIIHIKYGVRVYLPCCSLFRASLENRNQPLWLSMQMEIFLIWNCAVSQPLQRKINK